jgi:hypothetical protein
MPAETRMEACERRRRRAYRREVEDAQALAIDCREIVRQLANGAAGASLAVAWRQQLDGLVESMGEEIKRQPAAVEVKAEVNQELAAKVGEAKKAGGA